MGTVLRMNRNRQINLPSAFVAKINVGPDRYFKAELAGNRIILTPIDPVERVFTAEDLSLVEGTYQQEKEAGRSVTARWIKAAHRAK